MARELTIFLNPKTSPDGEGQGGGWDVVQEAPAETQGNEWSVVGEEPVPAVGGVDDATVQPASGSGLADWFRKGAQRMESGVAAAPPKTTNEALRQVEQNLAKPDFASPPPGPPIEARHASPHDFDRFNWEENIGSGEGNQMITSGTYLSTSPGVHKSYVNKFGGDAGKATQDAIDELRLHIADLERGQADEIRKGLPPYEPFTKGIAEARQKIQALEEGRMTAAEAQPWKPPPAKQYDVKIHANEDDMLDWAKPLSAQPKLMERIPPKVLQEIEDLADERGINGPLSAPEAWSGKDLVRALERYEMQESPNIPAEILLPSGKKHSSWMTGDTNARTHTAAYLHSLGIPGVRYPASGGKLDSAPNYVIFDDKTLEIIKKYGLTGLLGGGAVAAAASPGDAQAQEPSSDWSVVSEEPAPAPSRSGAPGPGGAAPSPPAPPAAWFDSPMRSLPPASQQEAVLTQGKTPFDRVVDSIPNPRNIPQRVAEDFKAGVATATNPQASIFERILGGGAAALSGISGASKALVRDPVLNATGDLKKANEADMVAGFAVGPGAGLRGLPGVRGQVAAAQQAAPAARAGLPVPAAPPVGGPPLAPRGAPPPPVGGPPTVPPDILPPPGGPALPPAGGSSFSRATELGEIVEPPGRALSDAEKKILSGLGTRKTDLPDADAIITKLFDNLRPFKTFDRAAEAVRKPGEETIHELARITRGSPAAASSAIRHGTYDYKTLQQNGPGLAQITAGYNADGLRAYMLAERTLELARRGMASGFDVAAAQKVVNETGGYYARVFQDVKAYQDRILQFYADSGFVSPAGMKLIRQLNQEYVPLRRILDSVGPDATGKNLLTRQVVRAIKGSDEYKTIDPLKSIVDNTYTMIALAERNRALTAFLDRAQRLQKGIPGEPLVTNRSVAVRGQPPGGGPPLLEGPMEKGARELAQTSTWLRGRAFRPGHDTVTVWADGKPQFWRVAPEIATAAKGLDEAQLGFLTNMLAPFARGVRHGVTTDPYYMIANVVRDQAAATMQSQSGYKAFLSWLSGAKSIARGDDQYRAWLRSGGAQANRLATEYDPARRDLNMISNNEGILRRAFNKVRHPIENMEAAKGVFENATRVGEYKLAMRKIAKLREELEGAQASAAQSVRGGVPGNVTPADQRRAAFQSREVTTDFQARGSEPLLQQLNALTAFLNGNMQGTFREFQTLKNQPKHMAGAAAALIVAPSVYTWYANHGDPRYDNATPYDRDNYWLVLPKDPNAPPIKVPKPFLPGQLGSAVERGLDKMFTEKPEAFKGFGGSLLHAVTPPFVPNVAQPILEHVTGFSMFRDRPIDSAREARLKPEERGGPGTSGVAKKIGEAFGVSPNAVDNYIQGWGGTGAAQLSHLPDKMLRKPEHGEAPEKPWTESPFLRRFFARNPATQPISDFYETAAKMEQALGSQKKALGEGRTAEAEQYGRDMVLDMRKARTIMGKHFAAIRAIETDKDMPAAQKRQEIMEQTRQALELAKEQMAAYHEAKKSRAAAP